MFRMSTLEAPIINWIVKSNQDTTINPLIAINSIPINRTMNRNNKKLKI